MIRTLFLSLLLSLPLWGQIPQSSGLPSFLGGTGARNHTRARLIAERTEFVPGETVMLGVVLEMDPHWHTYWINPGDSGIPTKVKWELPEGFAAGEILWPTPVRLQAEGLVSFAYEGKAVLRVPLQTPKDLAPGQEILIRGKVEWLECKEACIPGSADVELRLRAADAPGPANPEMTESASTLPRPLRVSAQYQSSGGLWRLRIPLPAGSGEFAEFFPLTEGAWQLEPAPVLRRAGDFLTVQLRTQSGVEPTPDQLRGVLRTAEGIGYELIFDGITAGNLAGEGTVAEPAARSLAFYLVMSFLAGAVMNLLPCIFPVLGLKISSFVEQAQGDRAGLRRHALVFAAGVLVSMWVFAAVVGLLGGAWGAQFQDPNLVIGMLLVLTFFTMNLFGVFEMGLALTSVGGGLSQKSGYAGSFFQGILLTVIGTPCTGPLLVMVMAWMLSQPLWIVFLVFTLMGLGLASPYVLLAYSPSLLDRLPPPGNWMVTFKKASAFAMAAFLWVLIYVLKGLIPVEGTVQVLGAMLLVCFAAWILGTWNTYARSLRVRQISRVAAGLVLIFSAWAAFAYKLPASDFTPELEARIQAGDPIRWTDVTPELAEELLARGVPLHYRPWSPELVAELRAAGRPVFVDFTADWCTICKLNKARALHKPEVMRAFTERGVVTLRADFTGHDERIADELAAYGRIGVPFYPLYGPDGGPPDLLPESLHPEIIFRALDKM